MATASPPRAPRARKKRSAVVHAPSAAARAAPRATQQVNPQPTDDSLASQVRAVAGQVLDLGAGALQAARALPGAASVARSLVGSGLPMDAARLLLQVVVAAGAPSGRAGRAGTVLRKLREAAGLTIDEVSQALDLKDPALIEQLERGKVALPFELILRLAAVLGRNDPVGFVMKMTRSANPELWRTLEDLGVGRLLLQTAREREFANIYRAHDAARSLSDADFAAVLGFTQQAFDTAMAFHASRRPTGR